jgi:hypothetical protein
MRRRRIVGSRTAVWRFFKRHKITFKNVARARRRWMREQGMFDPAHLVFIDESVLQSSGRSST